MLTRTYVNFKNLMSIESNISITQLILSCIGTVVTITVIVFGAYVSLRVENARLQERVTNNEKKIEKGDEKFDRIMDKLSVIEVKIGKVEDKK